MKDKSLALLGSLLAVALIAAGVLWAQSKPTKAVGTAVTASDEPRFAYLSVGDEEEEDVGPPEVEPAAPPRPGRPLPLRHEPGAFGFSWREEGGGAWLGVRLKDVTAEKAKELKLPGEYGVIVKDVEEESPAAKAGLAKDDVILEFAGEKVRSAAHLRRLVRETPPGRSVTLLASRAGQTRTLTATLAEGRDRIFQLRTLPPVPPIPEIEIPEFDFVWRGRGARLGISADELTPQLAEYFGVKGGKGILVREVVVGSAAQKAGLKAGDVIVAVDGKEVATVSKLRRALAGDTDAKRKATLTIVRDRREQTLPVELEPPVPVSPRAITKIEVPGLAPEELKELAAEYKAEAAQWASEYAAHARELAAEAMKARHAWEIEQDRLQEELRHLKDEQQKMGEEIRREIKQKLGVTGRVI